MDGFSLSPPEAALLHRIAAEFGTPFYVYDAAAVRARCAALKQALPDVDFFYSLKANPNLSLVRVLVGCGMGCEVSSLLELETALAAGAAPDRILMPGPGKSDEELRRAVALGIKAIVAESPEEVVEVDRIAGTLGLCRPVALRVNPDFRVDGARLSMGGRPTQFGIDEAGLPEVLARLAELRNIRLEGLHVYMGTRILSHEVVQANTRRILGLARQLQSRLPAPLTFVDVGGGFGVPYHADETALDLAALGEGLAAEIGAFRAEHPATRIVMELGRYAVAEAGRFITRIRQVKTNKGERFAVCDGGSNVNGAAAGTGSLLRRNFPLALLPADGGGDGDGAVADWTVTGPLCTPMDVLAKSVPLADPQPGDLICLPQAGAYGPTASPVHFIGFGAPAEVMVDGDRIQLVRRRDSVKAMLAVQEPRDIGMTAPTAGRIRPFPSAGRHDGSPFGNPCLDRLEGLGPLFRRTGERLEKDPGAWRDLWADPLVRALTAIGVPDDCNGFPLADTELGIDQCGHALHVAMIERLARLDAGCILALPGPSLAGNAVLQMGGPDQIQRFFAAYRTGPQGTFFGVTEPNSGSDPAGGRARLTRRDSGLVLNGTKTLVGGAMRARIGLVFCHLEEAGRTGLVMVEPSRADEHVRIERLSSLGLRGADLCRIAFTDFPVTPDMILGDGRPSLRDGFMAINAVFERNRPVVAALALGVGRGILDHLAGEPGLQEQFHDLGISHAALLRRLAGVIDAYERGRPKSHDISLIKMQAVAFADTVVERVFSHCPARLLRDPHLRRKCRDAKAFEYMEGASNIHALNAFRSYVAGVA
ncbi:acyl-CoA dehydrogenase family protein [Azospirillum sp. A23]|uniref:acyl-CoA dehydrogenase family protein n=1 Tax=Azospirillum sp. A23 TaxID=3160608 RepID=UPI0036F26B55